MKTAMPKKAAAAANSAVSASVPTTVPAEKAEASKTREQILAEREAKKLAKQLKKGKGDGVAAPTVPLANVNVTAPAAAQQAVITEASADVAAADKTREQIKAEREAKKLAKQAGKATKSAGGTVLEPDLAQQLTNVRITPETGIAPITNPQKPAVLDDKKKPALTKAERRAIQEAQRSAKAQAQKATVTKTSVGDAAAKKAASGAAGAATVTTILAAKDKSKKVPMGKTATMAKSKDCKVKLFNHLESACTDASLFVNNPQIHPSMARLGEQYAKRTIVGSNARCIGFLNALKMVIQDFETPAKKEFARSLETTIKICIEHLQRCRPLAVSVSNAYKHIKHVLTQLPTERPETELKEHLCHFIDTYIENQIGKAAQAISSSVQEKITNGDVILTFGCSSLINYICEEAHRRHVDFRVIVVDSRPFCEGQELLRRLASAGIPCTYVLINAVGFVMPEATKVLLGAHALLSNGYVMARTGTAQVALVARAFNVPVLVCCETHKFSERFQTDAIVYNELGNPDDLVLSAQCSLTNWQAKGKMTPLNLMYDITPPELVTAVVTEVSILPCTSVPVILRIKPTEIGYYS